MLTIVNSEFQRMNTQMRTMQDKLERVLNKLNSSSAAEDSILDASLPRETHGRMSPEDIILDHSFDVAQQSPSESPPCRGPTSSGFAFDVARGSLQAIGLNPIDSEAPSRDELDLNASWQHLADFGHFRRMFIRDPLWQIDQLEVRRLIQVFVNGPGSMYPVVDTDELRSRSDLLYSMMASARGGQKKEKIFPAAEALFSHETNVLKLVLAISLTLESCGRNEIAQRLFDSIGDAWQSSFWAAPDFGNIIIHVLLVGFALSWSDRSLICPVGVIAFSSRRRGASEPSDLCRGSTVPRDGSQPKRDVQEELDQRTRSVVRSQTVLVGLHARPTILHRSWSALCDARF